MIEYLIIYQLLRMNTIIYFIEYELYSYLDFSYYFPINFQKNFLFLIKDLNIQSLFLPENLYLILINIIYNCHIHF
jgi:hypothetical protein